MPSFHSTEKKRQAISLRVQGKSLRQIAKKLNISLSTVQLWTKEVILTDDQKQKIADEHKLKLILGREKFIEKEKAEKVKRESEIFAEAKKEFQKRKKDPFFMTGLALYWAEGFKKDHSLGFVNSDPIMVKMFLEWLKMYGQIEMKNVRLRVQIHKIYKPYILSVQSYWSNFLQIPVFQFQASYYQISKSNPELIDSSYRGLLRIRVVGSRNLFVKILGWLEEMKQ